MNSFTRGSDDHSDVARRNRDGLACSDGCRRCDFVMLGGQVGIIGHLTIGSGARIAGQSGVARDVAPGETVMGSPAVPIRDHHRQTHILRRLAKKGD